MKQLQVPHGVNQRLSALKYIIFVLLFGYALYDLALAERLAEVEPFKTAIILRFARAWPLRAVRRAAAGRGLFIERFYCRYLCPLGAALAIPARLRIFNWLKRYHDCGNPCQRCNHECPVQAIEPSGEINPNECIQCLHCQMLYHHDEKCRTCAAQGPARTPPRPARRGRAAGSRDAPLSQSGDAGQPPAGA